MREDAVCCYSGTDGPCFNPDDVVYDCKACKTAKKDRANRDGKWNDCPHFGPSEHSSHAGELARLGMTRDEQASLHNQPNLHEAPVSG